MKQYTKKLFILVFALTGLFIPVFSVHAQQVTDPFCDDGSAPIGGVCSDPDTGLTYPPTLCSANYDYNSTTKKCVSRSTTGGSVTPTPTPTPTPRTGGGGGTTGGGGSCEGFDNASNVNGICVPGYFDSGVAAGTSLGEIATLVIRLLLTLSGIVAVVLIIIGGFQFILSRGSEEAATKGKKTLTYAVVGLIVVIMSFVIVSVITGTLTSNNFLGSLVGNNGSGGTTGSGGPTPR